ncbi:hypothetical protein ABZ281_22305 [Streptomyces sp. NPDC006265]|uniref:hypothetical protein n=1 Tax=Streptomyces sp. NPDC006265 TaxID=3156740 RepID=UPI0033B89374
MNSAVAYDARARTQITGFEFTGFGATTTSATVPVVGEQCVGGDGVHHNGTWVSLTAESSTGGLSVVHGGTAVPLGS